MRLALIGDPVEHSRSPSIHEHFLREAGIDGSYAAIRVRIGEAASAIAQLSAQGFAGCNVTSPLKEEAFAACEVVTTHAREADAVNTIAFADRITGTNTDGIGAAVALGELMGPLRNRRIAVLGTGPTARAVVAQLVTEGALPLLWGRSTAKVDALCARFGIAPWEEKPVDAAFVALPPEAMLVQDMQRALWRVGVVMDANYGERSTLATQIGRPVADGSRMLEAQAKASFEFWSLQPMKPAPG